MAEKQAEVVVVIKRFLFVSIILAALTQSFGQEKKKDKLPAPEVNLLYSYYNQDGNNSAVTGGTGTEELDYHAPVIVINIPTDTASKIIVNMGVDLYSSASQDNIDFNVSSASAQDARTHLTLGYARDNSEKETSFGYHGNFSIESDYTSLGIGGFYSKGWFNYNSVFTLSGQAFFDDCRWGRLSADERDNLRLIYPEELRGTNWEDKYKRYTTTVSVGFTQLLSKRVSIGLFVDGVWQSGLLATTFHRVYFKDTATHVIEKLPYERLKLPIGFRVNYFASRHFLLRTYYRFYTDNWGLNAHTFEVEPVFKLNAFLSVFPFYRYYTQSAVFWFNPYKEHSTSQEFYTSDYDLSKFDAHKFGAGLNWSPVGGIFKLGGKQRPYGFQSLQFRLGAYRRSDGLDAYFLSTAFNFGQLN